MIPTEGCTNLDACKMPTTLRPDPVVVAVILRYVNALVLRMQLLRIHQGALKPLELAAGLCLPRYMKHHDLWPSQIVAVRVQIRYLQDSGDW
jgi:hypothetical protein